MPRRAGSVEADGAHRNSRRRACLPLHMRRSLLDMLWRAGGLTYWDAPLVILDDSLIPKRGKTAGPMLWGRLQRVLKDVCDGRATI